MNEQTPPADRLFAVRAQIKALEAEQAELRALLLSDPSSRTGNTHLAELKVVETKRTDWDEIAKEYPKIVETYTYPVTVTRIELRGITEDGEIVSLKRTPKLHTIRVV